MARAVTTSGVQAYSKEGMLSGGELWKNYSAALSTKTEGSLSGLLNEKTYENS